jgi:hypothetical protein
VGGPHLRISEFSMNTHLAPMLLPILIFLDSPELGLSEVEVAAKPPSKTRSMSGGTRRPRFAFSPSSSRWHAREGKVARRLSGMASCGSREHWIAVAVRYLTH